MTSRLATLAVAALLAMSIVPFANVASAMPIASALAIENTASTNTETVQFRRRGFGWGVGAGVIGGAIVGGMLANPYYYGPGPYYAAPGNAVAYCMQRYRSYDPGSGTYLGNDGRRHPCP
jgi:hypothetical protein